MTKNTLVDLNNHLRFDDPELTDTGVNVAEMLTEMGRRNKK